MKIASKHDIEQERHKIAQAARSAIAALSQIITSDQPLDAMYSMKFLEIGSHPLDQHPLNLIEQLNQTFTILASLAGVEILLADNPSFVFNLNPGARAGLDIISTDKTIVAEVFAAVDPANNRKLEKDIARLEETKAEKKLLFYFTPSNRDVARITQLHTTIEFRRLLKEEIMVPTSGLRLRESALGKCDLLRDCEPHP